MVKTWDVVIVGGGVIGLSVAWEVRKRGASVVVAERGEWGGEASSAAGGMLAWCDPHLPEAARGLALLSAECYGELIGEIEAASGLGVDLRRFGTIAVGEGEAGTVEKVLKDSADAIRAVIRDGVDEAMAKFNGEL